MSSASHASQTRRLLGDALKEELTHMSLGKITIRRLTEKAGVTRQAFYYHFADVHDLAVWVFEEEVANHIMAHATYDEWSDGLCQMLVYMANNREQTYAVLSSLTLRETEHFFHETLRAMMTAIVEELEGDLHLDPEHRSFIIDHFTLSVLGHLLHWFATNMANDPYVLTENIEVIMRGSVRASLERFAATPPPRLRPPTH